MVPVENNTARGDTRAVRGRIVADRPEPLECGPIMITALWTLTLLGLAAWTAAAWGLHHLLHLDASALAGLPDWIAQLPGAHWLERWWPDWQSLARDLIALSTRAQAWLAATVPWLVWAVWALGALIGLACAGLLHLAVREAIAPPKPAA